MRIALIVKDVVIACRIRQILIRARHDCFVYAEMREVNGVFQKSTFDLIIVEMRDGSSFFQRTNYLSWPRQTAPIVALLHEDDARGFDHAVLLGAVDCIFFPSDDERIMVRLNVVLAKTYANHDSHLFRQGPYLIDPKRQAIKLDDQKVKISKDRFMVALCLLRNLDRPLSRDYIYRHVRGRKEGPVPRSIDAHVSMLRQDLRFEEQGYLVKSLYGFGYQLTMERTTSRHRIDRQHDKGVCDVTQKIRLEFVEQQRACLA